MRVHFNIGAGPPINIGWATRKIILKDSLTLPRSRMVFLHTDRLPSTSLKEATHMRTLL